MSKKHQLNHRKQAPARSDVASSVSGGRADLDGCSADDVVCMNARTTIPRQLSRRERLIWSAVALHIVILAYLVLVPAIDAPSMAPDYAVSTLRSSRDATIDRSNIFNGGNPFDEVYGSCFQGGDGYAMCNPFVSVSVILIDDQQKPPEYVWLVRRRRQQLLQQGDSSSNGILQEFVVAGESTEATLRRLVKENVGIDINKVPVGRGPLLLGVYTDPPKRNIHKKHQRHIIRAVYVLRAPEASLQRKEKEILVKVPLRNDIAPFNLDDEDLSTLSDYRDALLRVGASWDDATSKRRPMNKDEIASDVARSLC